MDTLTKDEVVEKIDVSTLEDLTRAPRLSDLIRMGSAVTTQYKGWGAGEQACALAAGGLAFEAMKKA